MSSPLGLPETLCFQSMCENKVTLQCLFRRNEEVWLQGKDMSCSKCFSPTRSRLKPASFSLWISEELGARGDHQSALQHVCGMLGRLCDGVTFFRASLIYSIACCKYFLRDLWGSITVTVLCLGTRTSRSSDVAAAAMQMMGVNTFRWPWKCYLSVALVSSWWHLLTLVPGCNTTSLSVIWIVWVVHLPPSLPPSPLQKCIKLTILTFESTF